jgi:metal-dependent hydrolase (beta-lactamase superfamily II)
MLLGVIATGSTGNSYYIKADSGKILLLDAGVSISEIKKGIGYDIGSVVGCCITHRHL